MRPTRDTGRTTRSPSLDGAEPPDGFGPVWSIPTEAMAPSVTQAYLNGSARASSSSSPGSFSSRGLPGWMIATWQLSAASTSWR